ncbi:DUF4959 domain-containing protein [Sphingobacterium kyonggiense]
MKRKTNILWFPAVFIVLLGMLNSCKEKDRYNINIEDSTPPGPVTLKHYKSLYGGARLFYNIPKDEDLLSVEAEYTNSQGKTFKFNASYFTDSLDVYGLPNTDMHTIQVYAVDRAGNRSTPLAVNIEPLEPAYQRVARSMEVRPGFGSFFVDWKNELKQDINVYVDFEFTDNSGQRNVTSIFSSKADADRRFIHSLNDIASNKVKVKVRVEDLYGNITEPIEKGEVTLLRDELVPKKMWKLPNPNDSIGGVPMVFGNDFEGRTRYTIDGIINKGEDFNFMHTGGRGRTGKLADRNMPWNLMIDLGDYYELSRVVTHQRRYGSASLGIRGQYYRSENVGSYNMYYWDDDIDDWVLIGFHSIPIPLVPSDLDVVKAGEAGDMAYMYPDYPAFTKKTRWFRYEAISDFLSNYTGTGANGLSEITLYGRKASN